MYYHSLLYYLWAGRGDPTAICKMLEDLPTNNIVYMFYNY